MILTYTDASAEMSMAISGFPAIWAIDGNPETICHSHWEIQPWLRIILHRPAMIHGITVTNRKAMTVDGTKIRLAFKGM